MAYIISGGANGAFILGLLLSLTYAISLVLFSVLASPALATASVVSILFLALTPQLLLITSIVATILLAFDKDTMNECFFSGIFYGAFWFMLIGGSILTLVSIKFTGALELLSGVLIDGILTFKIDDDAPASCLGL